MLFRHCFMYCQVVSYLKVCVIFQVAKLPSESEVENLLLPPKPPSDSSKPSRKGTRTRVQQSSSSDSLRSSSSQDGKDGTLCTFIFVSNVQNIEIGAYVNALKLLF